MKKIALLLLLVSCEPPSDAVVMPESGWENIGNRCFRLEVPNGWVVVRRYGYGGGLCYVPDAEKRWKR